MRRLDSVMDVFNYEETAVIEKPKQVDTTRHELEATEEEIYRAQVSHHYIGALR